MMKLKFKSRYVWRSTAMNFTEHFWTQNVCILCVCMCFPHRPIFQQQLGVLQCNSISFWHYLPGESVRSWKLRTQSHKPAPHSDAKCRCRPHVLLTSHRRFPLPAPWGLLEWNVRKELTYYYWFIIKATTTKWKRSVWHGMWKGMWSFFALWACHCPGTSMCLPTLNHPVPLNLRVFRGRSIMWAWLIRSLAIGD